MKSRWIAAVAAAFAVALFTVPWMLRGTRTPSATEATADGQQQVKQAANLGLTLKDMNGGSVHLADFKGKVILLNVWATWCGPCQTEIPELVASYEAYKDKGVVVLGVSLDDTPEMLRAYASAKKISYPMLLMQDDVDQAFGPFFGVPVTIFIGRDGIISRKHLGPVSKEQVEREIKALL
jgi:thiol-disulfide isomerase/thioredoxin